jgi:hypothetical protein
MAKSCGSAFCAGAPGGGSAGGPRLDGVLPRSTTFAEHIFLGTFTPTFVKFHWENDFFNLLTGISSYRLKNNSGSDTTKMRLNCDFGRDEFW